MEGHPDRQRAAARPASHAAAAAPRAWLSLSVVVPVYNEEESVAPLVRAITSALRPRGLDFEIVLVDDGSGDETLPRLRSLVAEAPELRVVALRRNFGQTLALQAGLDHARGETVVTMDGDLQNDPADIPRLLEALERGADVVSGWRRMRQDTLFLRKIPSWIANRLIRTFTGVGIHDQGCALKAYRREVIEFLDLYGDMHRFIVVLTMALGARIDEVEVNHHPRRAGTSKYGISRTFKVLSDLLMIQMLIWFRESPLRCFAAIGTPFFAASVLVAVLWLASPGVSVVYPSVALIAFTTFVACLLFGLIGEALIENARRGKRGGVGIREWGTSHAPS